MAANALGSNVEITGLNNASLQGDRAVTDCLPKLRENTAISAKDIPDLIPVLSVVAAAGNGAVFSDIGRLRYKESDLKELIEKFTFRKGKPRPPELLFL